MSDDTSPQPPQRELSFEYERIHFGGRDITDEWQILLDIMGCFTIKVGSRVLYQEEGFSLVEFAIGLNDWLLSDFRDQGDFTADLTEYEEVGLVHLGAQGNHQWRVGSRHQQYEETTRFDADVIEAACRTYIKSVLTDLKDTFGIEGFPMTSRYVGQSVYIYNACPRCDSGVGFWMCGDGATLVLRCARCETLWSDPDGVGKHPRMVNDSAPMTIPAIRRGISRWATLEEIAAKGWEGWIASHPEFRNVLPGATPRVTAVRINIADVEPFNNE